VTLYIEPSGGFAGDMFIAALVDAGADEKHILSVIQRAAARVGKAEAGFSRTHDGCLRLQLNLHPYHHSISGDQAHSLLTDIMVREDVTEPYQAFGMRVLEHLCQAEQEAHQDAGLFPGHAAAGVHLHEAQDIIIDIMGAVLGLQMLGQEPAAGLLAPVACGGGTITFSHGTLPVPAPATRILIREHRLPVISGPINQELFTPTGAALLAGLRAGRQPFAGRQTTSGCSRGSRDLAVAPLRLYIAA